MTAFVRSFDFVCSISFVRFRSIDIVRSISFVRFRSVRPGGIVDIASFFAPFTGVYEPMW